MIRISIGFALFIGVLVVLADSRNLGPLMALYAFPNGDKIGHVMLYGVLALLLNLAAYKRTGRASAGTVALVSGVLAVLVTAEEASQLFFPSRTPDWFDLLASYIGIIWFTTLAMFIVELRQMQRAAPQT